MRPVIIAGNWKLNKTLRETMDFLTRLRRETDLGPARIVVCPVFTALSEAAEIAMDTPIKIGAQDVYWENSGAFTGEVSAPLLKDAGCEYALVGHSERRQFFGETDETVNKKTKAALAAGLTPIVCCGETLAERQGGKTNDVLRRHMEAGLCHFSKEQVSRCVIAYEPVWAIGTGQVATPAQAQEAHAFIRGVIAQHFGPEIAAEIPILYGGSVKPDNSGEILKQNDVDGALVGGASLDPASFLAIIRSANSVRV